MIYKTIGANMRCVKIISCILLTASLLILPQQVYATHGGLPDDDGDGFIDGRENCTGTWISLTIGTGTCNPSNCAANPAHCTMADSNGAAVPNGPSDYDGDGLPDGVEDNTGSFIASDHRGTDPLKVDTDDDLINDNVDSCPVGVSVLTSDLDGDGCEDNSEDTCVDQDDDTFGTPPFDKSSCVGATYDNCPNNFNPAQIDTDGDGVGDACEGNTDTDGDGVVDIFPDNCPLTPNPDQSDNDADGLGDACDTDDDNDGVLDLNDVFPNDPSETVDTDGDGVGDNADVYPNDPTRTVSCCGSVLCQPGDVNYDGFINTADILLLQQQVIGDRVLTNCE